MNRDKVIYWAGQAIGYLEGLALIPPQTIPPPIGPTVAAIREGFQAALEEDDHACIPPHEGACP